MVRCRFELIFTAIFFVLLEAAESLLGDGAGFITLAIGPVQKGVGHLMEPRHERQARRKRRTSYHAAAKAAIMDGRLTAKEKRYLDRLQKELGGHPPGTDTHRSPRDTPCHVTAPFMAAGG